MSLKKKKATTKKVAKKKVTRKPKVIETEKIEVKVDGETVGEFPDPIEKHESEKDEQEEGLRSFVKSMFKPSLAETQDNFSIKGSSERRSQLNDRIKAVMAFDPSISKQGNEWHCHLGSGIDNNQLCATGKSAIDAVLNMFNLLNE